MVWACFMCDMYQFTHEYGHSKLRRMREAKQVLKIWSECTRADMRACSLCGIDMGESSKLSKILNLRNSNFKTCRMPIKMNNFKFK